MNVLMFKAPPKKTPTRESIILLGAKEEEVEERL